MQLKDINIEEKFVFKSKFKFASLFLILIGIVAITMAFFTDKETVVHFDYDATERHYTPDVVPDVVQMYDPPHKINLESRFRFDHTMFGDLFLGYTSKDDDTGAYAPEAWHLSAAFGKVFSWEDHEFEVVFSAQNILQEGSGFAINNTVPPERMGSTYMCNIGWMF